MPIMISPAIISQVIKKITKGDIFRKFLHAKRNRQYSLPIKMQWGFWKLCAQNRNFMFTQRLILITHKLGKDFFSHWGICKLPFGWLSLASVYLLLLIMFFSPFCKPCKNNETHQGNNSKIQSQLCLKHWYTNRIEWDLYEIQWMLCCLELNGFRWKLEQWRFLLCDLVVFT